MGVLKVLTFGWEMAPIMNGGLGVVCKDLTTSLASKGVDVTFVVPKIPFEVKCNTFKLINASEYDITLEEYKKIKIDSVLAPYISISNSSFIKSSKKFNNDNELYGYNLLAEVQRYALIAAKIALNSDADIIHAHDWMTAYAGIEAKKVMRKPLIFHVHSTEYDRSAFNPHPLILGYETAALNYANKIIAVSQYTKNILINKYGIEPSKITVVHNAVNNEPTNYQASSYKSNKEKIVLFLARMSVQKGADYLLRAAQKVISKKKNVKFFFVGSGPMLNKLVEMSFDLGINDNVVFTGALNYDEVDKAYKHADLFVMPSVSEPFGLTPLEAMKNGTPVIISKQSGVSEVIKNCLKVDFWDVDEMASKILSILYNDTLSESLKTNGYHDINQLTWSTQADKVIEVYQEVL